MTEMSIAQAARMAGALYLMQMATGVFGFVVRSSLTVRGDAEHTTQRILGSERLFRVSILTDLATFLTVVALTWTLYVLLRRVNRDLALLAAFLRIVENAVLATSTVALLVALSVLQNAMYRDAFGVNAAAVARLLVSVQGQAHTLAFVPLGLGSAIFAYLLSRSGYIPRVIAIWGVFASLLLAFGSCAIILVPSIAGYAQMVSFPPMGIYEVGLGAWLLARGVTDERREEI